MISKYYKTKIMYAMFILIMSGMIFTIVFLHHKGKVNHHSKEYDLQLKMINLKDSYHLYRGNTGTLIIIDYIFSPFWFEDDSPPIEKIKNIKNLAFYDEGVENIIIELINAGKNIPIGIVYSNEELLNFDNSSDDKILKMIQDDITKMINEFQRNNPDGLFLEFKMDFFTYFDKGSYEIFPTDSLLQTLFQRIE